MQYKSRAIGRSGSYRLLLALTLPASVKHIPFFKMSSKCGHPKDVQFEEDHFGLFTDRATGQSTSVRRFTWRNSNNITVQLITYGATITSITLPDKSGKIEDIVLGFDDVQGYLNPLNPYFGATVGRVANRIGYAKITINEVQYNLSKNHGKHMLHGGFVGFDKVLWNYYVEGSKVVLSYKSSDGEEGFPGDIIANVTFQLTTDNKFVIDYKTTTTKPTYVNLTNHSYFNLAGHNKGAEELYKHVISINADRLTEVDEDAIPTGNLLPVAGTIFDLQTPKVLGSVIHSVPDQSGYDHNLCVNQGSEQEDTFIARASHPESGRVMEVYSNQPGVQFYTSNFLPEDPKLYKGNVKELKNLIGKDNANYYKHGAFCLETQNYPDAINHTNFPNAILNPGEEYHHTMTLKFSLQ